MKNLFSRLISIVVVFSLSVPCGFAQNVGINNTGTAPNASALLHVDVGADIHKGFLVTGTNSSSGTVPDLGAGTRMMFFPGRGAFRAGYVSGDQWDNINVGRNSFATGQATMAKGTHSTALGLHTISSGNASTATGMSTTASGDYATAMGSFTEATGESAFTMGLHSTASGNYATALGRSTSASGIASTVMGAFSGASGDYSTAMGSGAVASGNYGTALGRQTAASGLNATAMGRQTTASGEYSTAMGYLTTASGDATTAMGYKVSTNNQQGAFIIGDADPNNEGQTGVGSPNQFVARFWNGYYLMTSGTSVRYGVSIPHNGNAWLSICDANLKENFEPLDGESILKKFSNMKFSSWNYKKQDPKTYRHYGIMAQDFYDAFGKDAYGAIGNDTTVNPIDMIGIDMAAIQALEKRTTDLKMENEKLQESLQVLQDKFNEQQALLNGLVKAWNKVEDKKSR